MKAKNKTTLEELFYEESLAGIKVHQSEQENLDRVFNLLYELENEPSSDEDLISKQYLKLINSKAEEKRAIYVNNKVTKVKSENQTSNSWNSNDKYDSNNNSNKKQTVKSKKDFIEDKNNLNEKIVYKRFGQKALRKILRKYLTQNSEIPKEEIKLMIWVRLNFNNKNNNNKKF